MISLCVPGSLAVERHTDMLLTGQINLLQKIKLLILLKLKAFVKTLAHVIKLFLFRLENSVYNLDTV